MDWTSLRILLWQVCLIEALVCLILLLGILTKIAGRHRAVRPEAAEVERGAGALNRFPSAMAEYATHLKRRAGDTLGTVGDSMSSLTRRRSIPERELDGFSSAIAEYATRIDNNTSAIHQLRQASQELRAEVSRQNRVLSDLVTAINRAQAGVESIVESGVKPAIARGDVSPPEDTGEPVPTTAEELLTGFEKEARIPGHFRHRQQSAQKQPVAATQQAPTKQRSLATRHTFATREAIASKAHLISTR